MKYFIRDNSLNGTYVNEYRVSGNRELKEGDHVVFGHINGKNIKAGEYAKQVESEFHFMVRDPIAVKEKLSYKLDDGVNGYFKFHHLI